MVMVRFTRAMGSHFAFDVSTLLSMRYSPDNQIGDAGIGSLIQAFQKRPQLHTFNIWRKCKGFERLVASMCTRQTVTYVNHVTANPSA